MTAHEYDLTAMDITTLIGLRENVARELEARVKKADAEAAAYRAALGKPARVRKARADKGTTRPAKPPTVA